MIEPKEYDVLRAIEKHADSGGVGIQINKARDMMDGDIIDRLETRALIQTKLIQNSNGTYTFYYQVTDAGLNEIVRFVPNETPMEGKS